MSLPTQSQFLSSLTGPATAPPAGFFCGICLEKFQEKPLGELVAPHDDKHIYCQACLTPWLKTNATCPDCREVLFSLPTITRLTREEQRRLDTFRLEQILGWNYYPELLRSEDVEDGLVTHYLQETLRRLQERWEMYSQGHLTMNLTYAQPLTTPSLADLPVEASMPSSEDDEAGMGVDEDGFPLSATRLITAYFAGWCERFTEQDVGTLVHHPLATALLTRTIEALCGWDGWQLDVKGLRCSLRLRLTQPVQGQPEGWEAYVQGAIEEVVKCFEGVTQAEEKKLSALQRRALGVVKEHQPLWSAFEK